MRVLPVMGWRKFLKCSFVCYFNQDRSKYITGGGELIYGLLIINLLKTANLLLLFCDLAFGRIGSPKTNVHGTTYAFVNR